MGKKDNKSPKPKENSVKSPKSKKGKTPETNAPKSLQIDPELLKELTKDLKDVFRFQNGDVYIGQFTITTEGDLERQGRGKYLTSDGCSFSGLWDHDRLVHAERISYPDGSWYTGPLDPESGRYSGRGRYNLSQPQLGVMDCVFMQGRPLGPVTMSDKDDNKWQGQAGTGTLTLVPRNHLFDSEDAICQADKKTGSFVQLQKESLGSTKESLIRNELN